MESIERVVDEKVDARTDGFEKIINKDIASLQNEIYKVFSTKEDIAKLDNRISESQTDIIKWLVAIWVAQMAAIVFLIIK